jgi:signal transduction histidine kinase
MLCVNDTKPNKLTEEQIFALRVLGNHVAKLLDLRITKKQSEEKSKKIQSQNEVLQRMLSIIAHDVRGPIGSLKQIFELSEANMLDETSKQELLNLSKLQIDNILVLLNNLVDWGKIKIEEKETGNLLVKVKSTVDHEMTNISLAASLKKNTVVNLVDESVALKIDPDMLQFIIRNLLTNANKFTKEGRIVIYSDKDEPFTKLIVNDTGMGMTKLMVNNLLQNNNLMTTPGTNNEKGSGIGFKLIKEFMENIGGKIDISSEVNKGTSVNLYFPNVK